jgi:hypothetical protein
MARFLLLATLLANTACARQESARLSAMVAVIADDPAVAAWLQNPRAPIYVQAFVQFPAALGDDVIFGIDSEFLDGTQAPVHVSGGDWMALVGLQRTGKVWVARGTPATYAGKPSRDRTWEILDLGQPLQAGVWYRLRTVVNFQTRRYVSFDLEGPGIRKTLDLSAWTVDYPNRMPFDRRALTAFVFAMRGKDLLKAAASEAEVYFDDVTTGLPDGSPWLDDGFDTHPGPVPAQNHSVKALLKGIAVSGYRQKEWYLERDSSRCGTVPLAFAHSGGRAALCDATLRKLSYPDWLKASAR